MWPLKRKKNENIDNAKVVKEVKLGESFPLGPGEAARFELPISSNLYNSKMNKLGKLIARYEDKRGNIYETIADIGIDDIKNRDVIDCKKLKTKTKIIHYAPFKKRIFMIIIPFIMVSIIGIISYLVSGSYISLLISLGIVTLLQFMLEFYYYRVNKRYDDANKITFVKEK